MQKTCTQCASSFEITNDDLKFYDKISPVFGGKKCLIPPPTFCMECRSQRRLTWRNERSLYWRKDDKNGERILSMYSQDKPLAVYSQKEWWSDHWDPQSYSQSFDFSRPFAEQFKRLMQNVPHMALFNVNCEHNCEFVNIEYDDKNCYMCFGGGFCEDCYYGMIVLRSTNCVDCHKINKCDRCYELLDSEQCFECFYSQEIQNCNSCWLCYDCKGCSNCFGCTGLRNKEYHYFNEELNKEEYQKRMQQFKSENYSDVQKMRTIFSESILPKYTRKYARILQSENCTGDYITNSDNCVHCFEADESQDIKYAILSERLKDSMDCYISGWPAELIYDSMSQCVNAVHNIFSNFCWEGSNELLYCSYCFSCSNCFGCFGLRHKQYCILNKQYSKEEYEELVPRIIDHMESTGEWGEFFPASLSPFAYNESIAQDQYPLTKEEVKSKGLNWRYNKDEIPEVEKIIPAKKLPSSIKDIPDDILNWAIECDVTKRPFLVVKQELDFYRRMKLPIPRLHPDERHKRRMALRNPRKLWKRQCEKCSADIQTTYAPERPEIVYCEKCYLKEVY